MYTCAFCHLESCEEEKPEKFPANCPCLEEAEIVEIKEAYEEGDNKRLAHVAAAVEAGGYCKLTRLEEIMDFAHRMGYRKLGIAHCIGLKKEARTFCDVLKHNGFKAETVACKSGSIPKEFINISDFEKIDPGTHEPMCNPIGQAYLLDREGTDLNVILGLCVGHDTLFMKYSKAPVTVLAVKDRVLGHNPMAALYLADSYYHDKLYGKK